VCDADGPASLLIAEDLSGAILSATLEGTCTDVITLQTHGFTIQLEITWTGLGALERDTRVIRTDEGAICRQHYRTRPAGATGTVTVTIPTLHINSAIEVGPAPFHQLQRVDERCVTPASAS
jgi:hypothetical protein